MNTGKKMIVILSLLVLCAVHASAADDSMSGKRRGRHQGPPPEAYSACEEKSAGDTAQFESPRGDTVTGTCEEENGRLVLRPDNPPGKGPRRDEQMNSGE